MLSKQGRDWTSTDNPPNIHAVSGRQFSPDRPGNLKPFAGTFHLKIKEQRVADKHAWEIVWQMTQWSNIVEACISVRYVFIFIYVI